MVHNNMKRKEIDQKLQELEQQLRSEQGAYEYEEGVAAAGGGGGG